MATAPFLAALRGDLAAMLPRPTVRCRRCSLNQYVPASGNCRRCHTSLADEPEMPAVITKPVAAPRTEDGSVAVRAKALRIERGLSQRQLAARMDVPRTYISKIENGRAVPTLASMERLAAALRVDVVQLVSADGPRHLVLRDPFIAQIAHYLPHLSKAEQAAVLDSARRMADRAKERSA